MSPQQLLVADFMTIDPIVVSVDASIEEAAHLLRAYSISGLPVIDLDGALVGVISQTDLLAIDGAPVSRLVRGKRSALRVGELMSSPAVTMPMTGSLDEAARLMLDRHVHRVVAIDDTGRPVGVLSSMDYVTLYTESPAPYLAV